MRPKVSAVIVGGGTSSRMDGIDKLFLELDGVTVLERSVAAFETSEYIDEITVVVAREQVSKTERLLARHDKIKGVVEGGDSRSASARNGVLACAADAAFYAIHDAARPFVSGALIERVVSAAVAYGAAVPALPVNDTVKERNEDKFMINTPDRKRLVTVATPQVFAAVMYREAMNTSDGDVYDDSQLVERMGNRVKLVEGERDNIKLTTPFDIRLARQLAGESEIRIGQGYDVHRLTEGRRLVLGGVNIDYERGLLGHSDADVLTHAMMDALLGAASLGDIGLQFPDSDEKYKEISSLELLRRVAALVTEAGYRVGNMDATVVCQRPKLRPYISQMRKNLAGAIGISEHRVSVKATTEEGLGFTGDGGGIAAQAIALLKNT